MAEDIEFVKNFKFCFELRWPSNERDGGASHDGSHTHSGGIGCQNDRNNRNSGESWRNSRDNHNSGNNQANRGYLDQNGRFSKSNGKNSNNRGYETNSCYTNLHNRSPSRDRSGDEQAFNDFLAWKSMNNNSRSRRARHSQEDEQKRERPCKCRSTMLHRDSH